MNIGLYTLTSPLYDENAVNASSALRFLMFSLDCGVYEVLL